MNPILVALDVGSAAEAFLLADRLRGVVGGFKIGKELFSAAGPGVVRTLAERGERVFVDLKFHDIPNTVAGAIRSAAATGAWMVDVHASGGRAMLRAASEAASRHSDASGRPVLVVAVTVLTSLDQTALEETGINRPLAEHVVSLARLAQDAGLDGVVASPREIGAIRAACGPDFLVVTPGIRPAGTGSGDDQARTTTAAEAVAFGANFIVVGRPITAAPDARIAAERLVSELSVSPRT
jgi:orotidine-5'-phosphate decarboxylase